MEPSTFVIILDVILKALPLVLVILVAAGLIYVAVRSSENQIHKKLNVCCRIQAIFTGIELGEISELYAYHYVEARQVANYLADNKQ